MPETSSYPGICPFCVPDIQKKAFACSSAFIAIYNHAPILPGHTLIIPKMHVESLRLLPDDLIAEFFMFAREVTETLLRHFHAEAFDWSIQDNKAAGQTVPHLHLHIVVRHPGDLPDPGDWYRLLDADKKSGSQTRPKLLRAEYDEVTESLKKAHNVPWAKGDIRS